MASKCVVPNCTSLSKDGANTGVSWHKMPKDDELLQLWIKNIPRENWTPTKWSQICSLHFHEDSFTYDSQDLRRDSGQVKKRRLKKGSVPTVFPSCPSYLSKVPIKKRSEAASSVNRRKSDEERLEAANRNFLKSDVVHDFEELLAKLKKEHLPTSSYLLKREEDLLVMGFEDSPSAEELKFAVTIREDLSFTLTYKGMVVPASQARHLIQNKVATVSSVLNVTAWLNNYPRAQNDQNKNFLQTLASHLQEYMKQNELDEDQEIKLGFLAEQLRVQLAGTKKFARRYSPSLLACAMLWKCTSTSLYKQIVEQGVLSLPSVSHLTHMSTSLSMSTGLTDTTLKYLKARLASLGDFERIVMLQIDEMYTIRRLEFYGGKLFGYQKDGASKTLLVFMISSVCGKYQDVLAMYPTSRLTSTDLMNYFSLIIPALHSIGFCAIGTSVDSYTANRKFYNELCQGKLQVSIPHPCDPTQLMFLIIDSVHNLKNVYNNWLARRMFICPPFQGSEMGSPEFKHLEQLHELEEGKPVKMAYRLTKKSFTQLAFKRRVSSFSMPYSMNQP